MNLLVSIGTDGVKDWVRTPDGQKHSLGTHSVLSFVTKLSKNRKIARAVLNDFLRGAEAMLSVDEGKMWELLAPRRARWASDSDGPFMPLDQRHQFNASEEAQGTPEMTTLASLLDEADKALAYINKNASENRPLDPKVFKHLASIQERLASGQSDNSYFYGMPASPQLDKPEEGFANEETSPAGMVEMNKSAATPPRDVTFVTPPSNQGQTVEVSYSKSSDDDGYLYKKEVNRSNGKTTYYKVHAEDVTKKWEPWNRAPQARFKKMGEDLAFDTYEANLKIAETVLARSKATVATINKLASQGKRFNHVAAKADVARVASKVASICEKTALTEEWVQADLKKLAAESARIHGLFPKG